MGYYLICKVFYRCIVVFFTHYLSAGVCADVYKACKQKKPSDNEGFCGEYRSRTDDLLHAMQAL
jgi:hypothetical protein